MKKRYSPPPPPMLLYLDLALQLTLILQILSTALYFNGYFTNPIVNKFLLGETLALTAWLLFLSKSVVEKRLVLIWSPYYIPALVLLIWSGIRSFTASTPAAINNYYIFFLILSGFPLWVTQFRNIRFRKLYVWSLFFAGFCFLIGCLRQLLMDDPSFFWNFFTAVTLSSGDYERQKLGAFLGHNNAASAYIWITTIFVGYLWYSLRKYLVASLFGVFILVALTIIYLGGSRGVALMVPPALIIIGYGLYVSGSLHSKKAAENAKNVKKADKQEEKTSWYLKKPAIIGGILLLSLIILVGIVSRVPLAQKQIEGVFSRFLTSKETLISGTYPRVWGISLIMAHEYPLTGVGFSCWPYEYPYVQEKWYAAYPQTKIGLPPIQKHTLRAHNDYLQTWAELGVLGLICVFWLVFIHFRCLWRTLRTPQRTALSIFAGAATVATLVRAFFGFPFHEAAASCLFLANLALFSWYNYNKPIEWKPGWLAQSNVRLRQLLGIVLVVVYLIMAYPIYNYIVGDFSAQQYTIDTDYSYREPDPVMAQRYRDRGLKYLRESINYLPNAGTNLFTLGTELYSRAQAKQDEEMFLEGIKYLKRSLKTYSYYDTYGHLGRACRLLWEMTGKPEYLEESLKNFRKAVSIMPIFEEGWAQIGLLLAKSGQEQQAINLLAEIELKFPGFIHRTIFQGAKDAEARGDIETAALLFNISTVLKNEFQEAHFQEMIAFYLRQNRTDMAVRMLAGSVKNQSSESLTKALTNLLLDQLYKNQYGNAYQLTKELREKESLRTLPILWYYSGVIAWLSGHPWESMTCYAQSLELGYPQEQLTTPVLSISPLVTLSVWF